MPRTFLPSPGAGVVETQPTLMREEMHYNHDLDEALFILTQDPCIITGEEGCDACMFGTL